MVAPGNIISKEIIEVQYYGKADGLALQQDIVDWCRVVLNPFIENALRPFEQTNELLSFDTISIQIDLADAANWKEQLAEKIISELKGKLQSATEPERRPVKSYNEHFAEALMYFLKHGILPWNSKMMSATDFRATLDDWLNTVVLSDLVPALPGMRSSEGAARFTMLAGDRGIVKLAKLVAGEQYAESVHQLMEDVVVMAAQMPLSGAERQNALHALTALYVAAVAKQESMPSHEEIVEQWLEKSGRLMTRHFSVIETGSIKNELLKKVLVQYQARVRKGDAGTGEEENIGSAQVDSEAAAIAIVDGTLSEEFRQMVAGGVFVNNAGAVIIAAFLSALFGRCGLLENGEISDAGTALALLHYCISADTNAAEFELLLPKILCGVEPGQFVAIPRLENEMMKQEAEQMLASVIEYWSVLKDTSVQGLREAFLQRNGKLSFVNGEWLLQVEQRAYDMLLQQLPWNISMIKLPWMQSLLRTEWI